MPLGAARITFLAKSQVIAVGQRTAVTITASGNAQIDTAQSKFSGASVSAGATTDNLDAGSIVLPGQADYTVEFWFRLPNLTERRGFFGQYSAGASGRTNCEFVTDAGGYVSFFQPPSSSFSESYRIKSNSTISANTWHHCAITRDYGGTGHIMYIDGVAQTDTIADHSGTTQQVVLKILGPQLGTVSTDYYMDEFRVSDIVRYTSGFTPSTEPFVNDANTLLLLHTDGTDGSTVFLDDNGTGRSAVGISSIGDAQLDTAQKKFGTASFEFDGTGDAIRIPKIPTWDGSGDMTFEAWVRTNDVNGGQAIFNFRGLDASFGGSGIYNSNDSKTIIIFMDYGGDFKFYVDGGYRQSGSGEPQFTNNTWHHVAVQRSSGVWNAWVDGTRYVDYTSSTDYTATLQDYEQPIGFRGTASPADQWNGYMDEIRISSVARYTNGASITVPTQAFENDSDTVMLLHGDGTSASTDFADDNGQTIS